VTISGAEFATQIKIVRRLKAWPFDLTDGGYDVVYEGLPVEGFTDTGVKVPIMSITAVGAAGQTNIVVTNPSALTSGASGNA